MSCQKNYYGKSICGDCKRSVGFCSWSKKLIPVPGTKYTEAVHHDKGGKVGCCVLECPLYEKDTREQTTNEFKYGKWTEEERDFLLKTMDKKSLTVIAQHLGRSYDAVKTMAAKVRADRCVKN